MTTKAKTGSALRLRKSELFRLLGYEPHPGQVKVHRSKAKRRVLACGARWGKSTAGAMEAIAALLEPCESSLGWVVAPTYDLAQRILRRVEDVLTTSLSHRVVEHDPRELRLVVRNLGGGLSEVRGKSADRPVSLLGEALDWLIVDEAARLAPLVWETALSQRLVDRKGWALFLSTPAGPGWFYRLFKRGQGGDALVESWRSPTSANPFISPDVLDQERRRLSPDAFAQEYGAEFVGVDLEPCETCRGPNDQAMGVVVTEDPTELMRCPECEGLVDNGESLLQRDQFGRPHVDVIWLQFERNRNWQRPTEISS